MVCFEGFMIQSVCNGDIHEHVSSFTDQTYVYYVPYSLQCKSMNETHLKQLQDHHGECGCSSLQHTVLCLSMNL